MNTVPYEDIEGMITQVAMHPHGRLYVIADRRLWYWNGDSWVLHGHNVYRKNIAEVAE